MQSLINCPTMQPAIHDSQHSHPCAFVTWVAKIRSAGTNTDPVCIRQCLVLEFIDASLCNGRPEKAPNDAVGYESTGAKLVSERRVLVNRGSCLRLRLLKCRIEKWR